jgi:dihydrofolate synthase/folylpolyglutamate synthase
VLQDFLNAKPLYYDEIDYSRMPRIYEKIKPYLPMPKIIHLIGTNGKGTTGRFLATALYSLGFNVGHYTSPHILEFNERVWINGKNAESETLEAAYEELETLLSKDDSDALSYFEYTTLLSLLVYKECDYVVMEAGLGGEYDATAVFDKVLTLVTPIAYDHEAFLGNSIKEIATTKLNAIQNNAILSLQKETEIYDIAEAMAEENSLNIQRVSQVLDADDEQKIAKIAKKLKLESYLVQNLALSISALKFLNIEYNNNNFTDARLFGRLTRISENVIVDVGHNPLAAEAIREALSPEKYVLIYNSYQDKDYKKILEILKPIINKVRSLSLSFLRILADI